MPFTAPPEAVRLPVRRTRHAGRPWWVRLTVACAVALAALLGVLGLAAPAAAHASLTDSDPAQGSVVSEAPEVVTLDFSERVSVVEDGIRVLGPKGERADTGELRDLGSGSVVRHGVVLRSGLADGTYTVAWQVVSADSHPVSGAFTFSIGAPSQTSVELPQQQMGGGSVGGLYDAARYFAYGGYVLLIGGAAFPLLVWPNAAAQPALRRLVVGGGLTLAGATVVTLLLRHPYTTGGGLPDAFDLAGLQAVLDTKTGTALVVRLALLAATALFVAVLFGPYQRPREARAQRGLRWGLAGGGGLLALGLAGTWALSEHASTGPQTAVAIPVAFGHLLGMAVWLGGLTALLVLLLRSPRPVPRSAVRRFSSIAFPSVVLLVATGAYQSWRQVGGWSALTGTEYGRLLIAKLVLLAALLSAAWYSRRWAATLAPASDKDDKADKPDKADEPDEPGPDADAAERPETDPVRAAQLARQAAAVARARQRRTRDSDSGRTALRRSVLVEATVAAVLLAVTAVLTGTEPGRTAEARERSGASAAVPGRPVEVSLPFDTGGPGGAGTADLRLDPGRTGDNELRISTDVPVEEVRVSFTLPAEDLGPLPVTPERADTGGKRPGQHWRAEGVQLPRPGEWRIAVTVRTSEIDQITETRTVKIG